MSQQQSRAAEYRLLIAGFGGQGVLTVGKLLCMAAMREGKHVTYVPSYGSEVRGGTANCHVVISDGPVFNPLVEQPDSLIILNQLSYDRFAGQIRPGGLLVLNSSLVTPSSDQSCGDDGARMLQVPATQTAAELGNVLVANTIMLGAFMQATHICRDESIFEALEQSLKGKKAELLQLNRRAYRAGAELARERLQAAEKPSP